jgi:hypothetical protein
MPGDEWHLRHTTTSRWASVVRCASEVGGRGSQLAQASLLAPRNRRRS